MFLAAPALSQVAGVAQEVPVLSTLTLTLIWMLRGDTLLVQGQGDVPGLRRWPEGDAVHPTVTEPQVPQQQGPVFGEELSTAVVCGFRETVCRAAAGSAPRIQGAVMHCAGGEFVRAVTECPGNRHWEARGTIKPVGDGQQHGLTHGAVD